MRNIMRSIDAILTFILKLLFLYDLIFLMVVRPIEWLTTKRLSNALVLSKKTLNMSVEGKLLKNLKQKDYLKDEASILINLRTEFSKGVKLLDFNHHKEYFTEVNERMYKVVIRELNRNKSNTLKVQETKGYQRKQLGAKLYLISGRYLWYCIFNRKIIELIKRLNRIETIKKIRIYI